MLFLPTHRLDAYLLPAIQSILQQTLTEFELLIVVNERLHDRHGEILACCNGDPRVKLLEAPALGGLALALNLGIAAANSEYIARMDGDDVSLPTRLEQQAAYLDAHPQAMLVGCRMSCIDEHSAPLAWAPPHFEMDAQIRRQLAFRSPLGHPTLMLRRSVLYAVGGYSVGQALEDWELYLRLARLPGRTFHSLRESLLAYRRHGNQATSIGRLSATNRFAAGMLITAFLETGSPRYLLGALLRNPSLAIGRRSLRERLGHGRWLGSRK